MGKFKEQCIREYHRQQVESRLEKEVSDLDEEQKQIKIEFVESATNYCKLKERQEEKIGMIKKSDGDEGEE